MTKLEFHVAKAARDKYRIEHSLFSIEGDLIVADFKQARILANRINTERKSAGGKYLLTSAGQINALGLVHEIFHYIIRIYEQSINPGVFSAALKNLHSTIGEEETDKILTEHIKEFPPLEVYKGRISIIDYLNGYSGDKPNREIILEELILLNLENNNPAAHQLLELFTDESITRKTAYPTMIEMSDKFFANQKSFGPDNESLLDFLKKPIVNHPNNLEGQLEFMRTHWGVYIYDKFNSRLLSGRDLITEDLKLFINMGFGPKPTPPVPQYKSAEEYLKSLKEKIASGEKLTGDELDFYNSEIERFTKDIEWMPKVVMIAKNTFVWMDQLSKKYGRSIRYLNEIPDEELDRLSSWNFTALWLIGIWERSSSSRKIKQLTGNPEAASSAYSLFDYTIAAELGGETAFENLKHRAWQKGIRLASDMVPNHTGIYSRWVIEKPDYFIQSYYLPFPSYTFNGPNLSDDQRVEVRIEDKYYSREDAAVVFQRRDSYTGSIRYIYHGNDGTHMPWNDTAQLNLLLPEVREALIQMIMHIARRTPIIRFDAAMTLTKKHFQRLWFPQPGSGGDIPSRSDYAMTKTAFDANIPEEFWREVVDRINKEMPDTLLLAEAFWLMEGFFVRTLGMHRVYNSAFMHMLMKEENSKYRELIKNTLDFNPEILKRYVNFMSNPDEETAINQFGKGDKYFGVAVLMVTLPGLPMFGHGQVEGLSEKYGMEYKRAYYNEFPDQHLVQRHEYEVFPLMRKRYLFSQVDNFNFYDFLAESGNPNENVFAFSNQFGSEYVLVIYNNAYEQAKGHINYSVLKATFSGEKKSKKIATALNFNYENGYYYVYREHKTKLQYIVPGRKAHDIGIFFELNGYQYKVFQDFKEFYDTTGEFEKLYQITGKEGIPSIEEKLKEIRLAPIHESFNYLFNENNINSLNNFCFKAEEDLETESGNEKDIPNIIYDRIQGFLNEIKELQKIPFNYDEAVNGFKKHIKHTQTFFNTLKDLKSKKTIYTKLTDIEEYIKIAGDNGQPDKDLFVIFIILDNIFNSALKNIKINWAELYDNIQISKVLLEVLKDLGLNIDTVFGSVTLLKALVSKSNLLPNMDLWKPGNESLFISELINDKETAEYILLNEFEGVLYYNKERFEILLDWMYTLTAVFIPDRIEFNSNSSSVVVKHKEYERLLISFLKEGYNLIRFLKNQSAEAGYRLVELKKILYSNKFNYGDKSSIKKNAKNDKRMGKELKVDKKKNNRK